MVRKPRKEAGFTLIELLVVVVIIGILASVAIPNFVGAQDKAKNSGVQSNGHRVQMAIEQYAVDYSGVYPSELASGSSVIYTGGPLSAYPKTPWNGQQTVDIATCAVAVGPAAVNGGNTPSTNPTHPYDYGAIGYGRAGSANERYELTGTGKSGNNSQCVFYVTNN